MSSIVTLCLSAGIQKTISFDSLKTGAVNRSRSYIYDAAGKAVNSARVLTQLMEADDADSAPAAPDDVTLICPLGKKNADFFLQLAARDGLNPETVLIPGYTRECCTLLDDATGEVTELVVEEPAPEGDAPVSDLLFTLRTALARASAFNRLEDSTSACQASAADKASGAFKACPLASENSTANKASSAFKTCPPGSTSESSSADKAAAAFKAAGALPRMALLFAGSRPAFWPQDIIQQIALAAKKAGALFMADFRGNDLLSLLPASTQLECTSSDRAASADKATSAFKACAPALTPDIIKINEAEFRETFMRAQDTDKTGKTDAPAGTSPEKAHPATNSEKAAGYAASTDDAGSLAAAICEKSREFGNIIVVTRGADSTLAADHGTLYECASEKVRAVNTIGCGDSFNAGFLYEYMTSGNVEMALKKGTWCAARNAERLSPGTIR